MGVFSMTDKWRQIQTFPGYSVSDAGSVRNDESGRIMAQLVNQSGVVNVGLTKNRVQYKRSVSLLVADTFMRVKPSKTFDTPINLDGDRYNNGVDNLMWRPRWFAVRYAQQFYNDPVGLNSPVEEVETGEHFNNAWEAAIEYGLLAVDIILATKNRGLVRPTFQRFRMLY